MDCGMQWSILVFNIRLCAGASPPVAGSEFRLLLFLQAARIVFRKRFSDMNSTREPGAVARRRIALTAVGNASENVTETATWKPSPFRL